MAEEDETYDHIIAHLHRMVEFMAGAPVEFWTHEHRAVIYHAMRLVTAMRRDRESAGSGTLVSPVIPGVEEWLALRD